MSKHTPGPVIAERASGGAWEVLDDETLAITVARCTGRNAEGNAKRIEALWNAYAGGALAPADAVETLAEKMANAQCESGESVWPYLADSDRAMWKAAARVALVECAAIAAATNGESA